MAHITRHGKRWRAQVDKHGVRLSKVHDTKAAAQAWATAEEAKIIADGGRRWPAKTLADALDRYMRDVSPGKASHHAEVLRLEKLKRDHPEMCAKYVSDVTTPDLVEWRTARLKAISPGSVRRDANVLRNVFTVARDEWHWLGDSPFKGFKIPSDNPPRTRRVDPWEARRICRWLGFRWGHVVGKQQYVALAFLFALRSGMRSGEILALTPANCDLESRVARIPHKTQYLTGKPREVPMTRQAVRLLRMVEGREPMFDVSASSLDALFRKATRALLIKDMHFHDSRAEALTRLALKVDVLTLSRISGIKDLQMLNEVYYRESSASIAARL